MAYATVIDVKGMVSIKSIDDQSEPSAQEVIRMLEDIAGDVNMAVVSAGYDAPVSSSASDAYVFLRQLNAYGVAMRVEASSAKGEKSAHLAFLERHYTTTIKDLRDGNITLPGLGGDTTTAAPRTGGFASSIFTREDER